MIKHLKLVVYYLNKNAKVFKFKNDVLPVQMFLIVLLCNIYYIIP